MVQFRVQAIPEWSEPELNPELIGVSVSSGGGPFLVQLPSHHHPHPHPCPPSHTQSVLLHIGLLVGLLVGTSILQLSETLKCYLSCHVGAGDEVRSG